MSWLVGDGGDVTGQVLGRGAGVARPHGTGQADRASVARGPPASELALEAMRPSVHRRDAGASQLVGSRALRRSRDAWTGKE